MESSEKVPVRNEEEEIDSDLDVNWRGRRKRVLIQVHGLGLRGWLLLLTILSGLSVVILTIANRIAELLK
jgi:hypothetical protein